MSVESIRKVPTLSKKEFLDSLCVWPVFQPLVDLYQEAPIGYEVLTRGQEPYANPLNIFSQAQFFDARWETEAICREAAFKAISEFDTKMKNSTFFINISPNILCDPRIFDELSPERLRRYGICPEQIVLEITEEVSLGRYIDFDNLIARLREMGFRIAVDDFGYGSASLYSIVAVKPDFLKLDKSLIRNIHRDLHKVKMVRALQHLCEDMNMRLVAEGVEEREELQKLSELGVRFTQGYYLGHPRARPSGIDKDAASAVHDFSRRMRYLAAGQDTVRDIMQFPITYEEGHACGETLYRIFTETPEDHVVLMRDGRPRGLITKSGFMANTSGAFGYSLLQKRPADRAAKQNILCVNDEISIVELAKTAMERSAEDVYDPVVIVNSEGIFQGTVAIRMLILRASQMEVDNARDSNPLTGLPGNRRISEWISQALKGGEYCVVYFDLNRFKEYNDVYGFAAGDEMIRLAGEILKKYEGELSENGKLGHLGGDDFIFVSYGKVAGLSLQQLCEEFDKQKRQLFKPEHLQDKGYYSKDRRGADSFVPLVSVSAAAVPSSCFNFIPHPAQLAKVAAELKKVAKEDCKNCGGSCSRFERRIYTNPDDL